MYNSTPFSPHLREGLSESDKNEGNLTDGGGGGRVEEEGGGLSRAISCYVFLSYGSHPT